MSLRRTAPVAVLAPIATLVVVQPAASAAAPVRIVPLGDAVTAGLLANLAGSGNTAPATCAVS